jgi:hypothetical protein
LAFLTSVNPLPLGRYARESAPPHSQAQEIADFAVIWMHLAFGFQRTREHRTPDAVDATGGNGGACHTGRRSCFYRKVALGGDKAKLVFD